MADKPTPVDFNGAWASSWGDMHLHQQVSGTLPIPMKGTYYQGEGIIQGTLDPKSRTFEGTFKESFTAGKL